VKFSRSLIKHHVMEAYIPL